MAAHSVTTCKTFPGIKTRHGDVDIVIIRQNTEGEYSHLEHEISPGIVESLKVMTKENSLRIAKFAFDYATQYSRAKVTAVHKANIMLVAVSGALWQCALCLPAGEGRAQSSMSNTFSPC